MKVRLNPFVFFLIFLQSASLCGQDAFHLKDYEGNIIEFFLVSKDGKTVLKSQGGALNATQLKNNQEKLFTLHFDNHLAYLLYHNDLYFKNGISAKDPHMDYDTIRFDKIDSDHDGVFYVRRKEIRLDSP